MSESYQKTPSATLSQETITARESMRKMLNTAKWRKIRKHRTETGRKATLKQINTIRHLETSKSLAEAMRKGGYSATTAYNGDRQQALRKILADLDICSPERVKSDLSDVFIGARKEKDWTNCNRNIEIRAKVGGLIRPDEKNIQIDKLEITYKPIGVIDTPNIEGT